MDGESQEFKGEGLEVIADLIASLTSAVPIAGAPVASTWQAITNHRIRKSIKFLTGVLAQLGGRVDRLEEYIQDSSRAADVLIHGEQEAAGVDEDSTAFFLLAQISAFGVQSEANVDRAHILLDIVGQLHPDHLQVLREIGTLRVISGRAVSERDQNRGKSRRRLLRYFPDLANTMDPLVARLVALGLARDVTEPPTIGRDGKLDLKDTTWALTPFGSEVLDHLDMLHRP